jgi:Secretion system C-terminal sorting domain
MKKIFILCFSVLCTNLIWGQQDININAPSSVEVGLNSSFGFQFRPVNRVPANTTSYKVTSWFISAPYANMNNSGQASYSDNSQAFTVKGINETSNLNFPIRWEDNSNNTTDLIRITVAVSFTIIIDKQISYSSENYALDYKVNINRLLAPTISYPVIKACSTDNVVICASNYGTADSFAWSVTNASIVSGQGSSCITVKPAANDVVTSTCIARRSAGLPSYSRSNTNYINRTARTVNYAVVDTKNWLGIGAGRSLSLASQNEITSINWVAPGCTIAGQGTVNATITPTTAVNAGTVIGVYATITFAGGCTANSPTNSYTVFNNTTPPIPVGNISVTPDGGNVCTAQTFTLDFVGSNTSYWPVTMSSRVIFAATVKKPIQKIIQVCYSNPFTGINTCKSYGVWPPVPCVTANARIASSIVATPKITIESNPTSGNVKVTLPATLSGNYQIFDSNNNLVQEAKFNNESELQIELANKLKSGIYILKVFSENNIFTDKIILNR